MSASWPYWALAACGNAAAAATKAALEISERRSTAESTGSVDRQTAGATGATGDMVNEEHSERVASILLLRGWNRARGADEFS